MIGDSDDGDDQEAHVADVDTASISTGDRSVRAALGVAARLAWFIEDEVRAVSAIVPAGGICVDVGAAYGLYTAAMAAAVGPRGTVHAVEPQPTPNRVIDRIVRLSGTGARVVRHRFVLGDRPGHATLSVPLRRGRAVHGRAYVTRDALHGGPNTDEFAAERRLEVDVTTLDALVDLHQITRLDMIKADVEGAELSVLRGGSATIDRFRPAVQLEIEERHLDKYGHTVQEVTGFLLDRGYSMHSWNRRAWVPAQFDADGRRNYLFLP